MNTENALIIDGAHVQVTEIGLRFDGEISFEQWLEIGRKVGRVARTSLFLVGDWLNYGQDRWNGGERFEKMAEDLRERYESAMAETGLEMRSLMNAAYVARNVPQDHRRPHLTFEHHTAVARVKDKEERRQWLAKADKHDMSTRRLRKSINLGRVATEAEMQPDPKTTGIDNHLSWIDGLMRWWKRFERSDWMADASREMIEEMLSDFRDVQAIIAYLEEEAQNREPIIEV
ncbi:MAG: hypothetical protein AB3N64_08540 [Puniceicoccaceae bacterium]